MSSVTIRVGAEQHADPTFSWWELYGSQTNHALADVIANAEFDTFFFGRHAHHVNLTIGETWHYWARAAYDRGATFTALTYLGSVTITGSGEHMPAWTIKMRNAASTGAPHNVDFNDLTEEASPAAGDKIPGWLSSGELRMFDVGNMPAGGGSGGESTVVPPQGRLTLTSATPVLTTSVTAATTIYYTPYVGRATPIYDGSDFVMYDASELSQATTDSTKSPAAVANNSNYDLFRWVDAGTQRCTRGPSWTSDTARGTGAGTTELERINGIWVNKVAITNGPAAQRGTYVGTVRSNGSAQIDMIFGGTGAAGGESSACHVWNTYNRVQTNLINFDNTDSWAYTTDTWREKNNNSANRFSFILGLSEDGVVAHSHQVNANSSAGIRRHTGLFLDSITAYEVGKDAVSYMAGYTAGGVISEELILSRPVGIGYHYIAQMEKSQASGTTTWYGDNGSTTGGIQSFATLRLMA